MADHSFSWGEESDSVQQEPLHAPTVIKLGMSVYGYDWYWGDHRAAQCSDPEVLGQYFGCCLLYLPLFRAQVDGRLLPSSPFEQVKRRHFTAFQSRQL